MTLRLPCFGLPLLLCSSLAPPLTAQSASGGAETTAESAGPTTDGAEQPLRLHIAVGAARLEADAIRRAIERELGQQMALVPERDASLRVTLSAKRVRVSYTTEEGAALTRAVDLPSDGAEAIEVIALLVGNLVRNEASDLLKELHARAARPKAVPVEAARTPPTPAALEPKPASPAAEAAPKTRSPRKPTKVAKPVVSLAALKDAPVNLSLYAPLAVYRDAERRVVHVELGLAYSHVGALGGAGLSFGALHVEQSVNGVAWGGLWNRVRGPVTGVAGSFVFSQSSGPLTGLALAGVVSLHDAPLRGLEVAGAFAASGDTQGLVLAGAATRVTALQGGVAAGAVSWSGTLQGASLAGALNVAGEAEGFLAAGGLNVASSLQGVALAGGANLSGDVTGVTVAVINVGRRVTGAQLGVVNVSSEMRGAAVGLLNIAGNGRIQPTAWGSSFTPLNLGVRFIAGHAFSLLGAGIDPFGASKDELRLHGGLGPYLTGLGPVSLAPGLHYSQTLHTNNVNDGLRGDFHYWLTGEVSLGDRVHPFFGGGLRHRVWGSSGARLRPEFVAGAAFF